MRASLVGFSLRQLEANDGVIDGDTLCIDGFYNHSMDSTVDLSAFFVVANNLKYK